MSCNEDTNITIDELEDMLQEAKKGRAKVDKQYVDYKDKGQLFEYKIDFNEFLEDIDYILKAQNGK